MANGANGGGSHLHAIHRNKALIAELDALIGDPQGLITVNSAADVPDPVGGVITLNDSDASIVYVFNRGIDWTPNVFEGRNVTLIGNQTLQTFQSTVSSSPMFSSNGDGNFTMLGLICTNPGGPFVDMDLGSLPLSVFFMDSVFFTGDPLDTGLGVGSLGTIKNTDRVSIQGCFFQGLTDGIKFAGTNPEVNIVNCSIRSRQTIAATAFKGIEVMDASVNDIISIVGNRFATNFAADRAVKFSSSATYSSPLRVSDCTIRGPGTFVDTAGLEKTDVDFLATSNEGVTAPVDSEFTASASFIGNTTATDMSAVTVGDLVPIGNGAAGHTLFNGGAFVERFTLSGAETQLQKFTYNGKRTRTFKIEFNCQLTRAGGGSVSVALAVSHQGSTIASSVTPTEVANTSAPGRTSATIELAPGDTIELEIANNTSQVNLTVLSGFWDITRT